MKINVREGNEFDLIGLNVEEFGLLMTYLGSTDNQSPEFVKATGRSMWDEFDKVSPAGSPAEKAWSHVVDDHGLLSYRFVPVGRVK